ncbi:hypothetical protein PIROE2DRAFT_67658 [Piromyces sp. E2]|nr:hypothetical protein PIROE2DRAFT_67658 [Piromyces sp. E2]|eukprot:OUM59638.1 hypothetical protein PIROE2DRAFT_67658 [Piromyces sp. E2]
MHFNIKTLLIALVAVPAALGTINGKCSSGNGVCVKTSDCTKAGGTYVDNKCPNDPKNVKCCNKTKCVTSDGLTGTCKFTSDCNGTSYSGVCPGGKNFKCCVTSNKKTNNNNNNKKTKVTADKVIKYAKNFIGNPYVWGGNSLTKGCDCSGFVKLIFKKFGIELPRVSADQSNAGTKVTNNIDKAKAGDLLFYCTDGKVTHVTLYEGNYKIVHAANSKRGIVEDNIKNSSYYKKPCKIRRIL